MMKPFDLRSAVRAARDHFTRTLRLESTGFDEETGDFVIVLSAGDEDPLKRTYAEWRVSAASGGVRAGQSWIGLR